MSQQLALDFIDNLRLRSTCLMRIFYLSVLAQSITCTLYIFFFYTKSWFQLLFWKSLEVHKNSGLFFIFNMFFTYTELFPINGMFVFLRNHTTLKNALHDQNIKEFADKSSFIIMHGCDQNVYLIFVDKYGCICVVMDSRNWFAFQLCTWLAF